MPPKGERPPAFDSLGPLLSLKSSISSTRDSSALDVNSSNPDNFVPLENVHLGPVVNAELFQMRNKNPAASKVFQTQCRWFSILLAG